MTFSATIMSNSSSTQPLSEEVGCSYDLQELYWAPSIEIQVDSGSSYRELHGKQVPIIIRNLQNIYIQNIQAKHTYW